MDNHSFNLMLLAGGSALVVLTIVLLIVKRRYGVLRQIAELMILLLSMGLLACWMKPGTMVIVIKGLGFNEEKPIESMLVAVGYMAMFWMPLLLLSRFRINRSIAIWACLGWWMLLTYIIYLYWTVPLVTEIRKDDSIGIFNNTILISSTLGGAPRLWLWSLLSVLCGFYAIRNTFSYGRLFLGSFIATILLLFFSSPFILWDRSWLAPFCFASFACLIVLLPIQRQRLEKLLGISLSRNAENEPIPNSSPTVWTSFAGHCALVIVGLAIMFSAAVSYFEKQQQAILHKGSIPSWRSPAETNAYESMKRLFRKGTKISPSPQFNLSNAPVDYNNMLPLVTGQIEVEKQKATMSGIDAGSIQDYLKQINDYIRDYEHAARADYVQFPSTEVASFLNLRETERAINRRSLLALNEGNTTLALEGFKSNLRLGGLLNSESNLVMQMMGVALRNEALRSSANMLSVAPQNREFLDGLEVIMKESANLGRQSLNYDSLKRGELGTLVFPIVPNADIVVAAFARAHNNTLVSWANFDLLQMAVALEQYRLDHQSYPQSLADLVPQYLPSILREPFQGRDYTYIYKTPELYELFNPAIPKEEGVATPIHVPPMTYKESAEESAKK